MTYASDLPDDIDALKAIILASQAKMTEQDGIIERKEDRIIRLEKLLADLKRALFGAKSEKGHPVCASSDKMGHQSGLSIGGSGTFV